MIHFLRMSSGLCLLLIGLQAFAIAQTQTEERRGTVAEIQKKGRLIQLLIDGDQDRQFEVALTPRLDFRIVGKGDAGFVAAGQFLEAEGVLTNERLFISKVNIVYVPPGKRSTLRGQIVKAPPKPGASQNTYRISGLIKSAGNDPDYAEYTLVQLEGGRSPLLMLEKDFSVQVAITDPEFLATGQEVTVQGVVLRGDRYNATQMVVRPQESFASAELLKAEE